MNRTDTEVEVEGRHVRLSNLDKVLFPVTGFTKAQVIDHYVRLAPVLLPHLRDRPLTLNRFPDGVEGGSFYEKQCPSYRPPWLTTARVRSTTKVIEHCLANDLPSLVWLANIAAIEVHPLLARYHDVQCPTKLTLDLDPGPPAGVVECCEVALRLREVLDGLGLRASPKTSGSKGLQVEVPLNTPVTYAETKPFARALAQLLEAERPHRVVSRMDKRLRGGKVLIDWSQNHDTKTTVCVYSLRARPRPTVSTPLTWDEVERTAGGGDAGALAFETGDVLRRLDRHGDLFAPVLELRQELPALDG